MCGRPWIRGLGLSIISEILIFADKVQSFISYTINEILQYYGVLVEFAKYLERFSMT